MNNHPSDDSQFEVLLDYLKRNRGFDFTGYKRQSLMRRVLKRMMMLNISDFVQYLSYLEAHPTEFVTLFNTILINVTSFFRDIESWQYLQAQILPKILSQKRGDEQIRVWSAGCASGQEAYSIAMAICELLGDDEFYRRVKIYATDIDEEALSEARQAIYSAADVANLPEGFLDRYFTPTGSRYAIRPELRRSIIFGRHDLMQDAPISHLDLLICRNTLMYLNGETQRRILGRLHFALNKSGYLFLGKAEMLLTHVSLFKQVDIKHRVFAKVPGTDFRDRLLLMTQSAQSPLDSSEVPSPLSRLAFDATVKACLVIDQDGKLAMANQLARNLLGILTSDILRPFPDLEISYKPVELRSLIDQAKREDRSVIQRRICRLIGSGFQYLDVEVKPLKINGLPAGCAVMFEDSTKFYRLYDELESARDALETTNEELQSTNEELETTNEELQSTNEELETTNEELQSANEEIETTNEELHSANEELETINVELQSLMTEVNDTNMFLQTILSSLPAAVIVLDKHFKVWSWNPRAEDLWGLRSEEVIGQTFNSLDIGLPVQELEPILQGALETNEWAHRQVSAVNRKGKQIICDVTVSKLRTSNHQSGIVIFIDEVQQPN